MEHKLILKPHVEGKSTMTKSPYRQLIGSMMYFMICTRPDIAFAVGVLSKFTSSATDEHYTSAKRVLRYLQATKDLKLGCNRDEQLDLVAYSDADWASSYDRRSTTGYLIYVGGNLVSWLSKKQSTFALSSTEAEIIAATETMRELLWIQNLLLSVKSSSQHQHFIVLVNQLLLLHIHLVFTDGANIWTSSTSSYHNVYNMKMSILSISQLQKCERTS